jgi:molybdopterin synthase sulfur carrier subunit
LPAENVAVEFRSVFAPCKAENGGLLLIHPIVWRVSDEYLRRMVMSVRVRVPTPLRKFTNGADEVSAQGNSIKALVDDLEKSYPGIKERICDETGKVRRFVNVYVNGDDIRFLQNLETSLKEGDNISIVPAIAGGR